MQADFGQMITPSCQGPVYIVFSPLCPSGHQTLSQDFASPTWSVIDIHFCYHQQTNDISLQIGGLSVGGF